LGCNNTYIDTVDFVQDIIDFEIEDGLVIICGETDVVLNPNPNPDYEYIWTTDTPGIIVDPNAATQELTLDQTVEFYVTAFLGDCRAHDTVLVETQELEVDLVDDQNDVYYYCEGDAVTLEATSNAVADFEWFDENGDLLGSGSPYSFFPDSAMQLTLIAANQAMCTDTATFSVTPYLFDGEIIGDDFVCVNELFQLQIINTEDTLQNFNYTWVPFPDGGSGTQVEYQVTEDTDILVVVQNQFGCNFELNYVIEVDTFETLFITAEPSEILLLDSTQLIVEEISGATYEWSPPGSLDDPNISNPIAFPENDGIVYSVTVTNENGCTAVATIPVVVIEPNCDETDIFVPNTFTPNGDNFNDTFAPISNFIDLMDLVIYNRWGEEVFKSNDPNDVWDGTFDGEQLEPDVFGFHLSILCIGGETYVKQGSITLMK
jgi:gliding motility-associated-like protein